ncbi:MAG: phosphate ABC transporter substrate-binding protein PstS [Nitrososphaerota archaeon]|nr:phosphate ABC transporter substrate-binding protein PstS [Nitrososphaerota archaeon]
MTSLANKEKRQAIGNPALVVIAVVLLIAGGGIGYFAHSGSASAVTTTVTGPTFTTTVYSTVQGSQTSTSSGGPTLPASLPTTTISETGSTLLYPLFNYWVPGFNTTYTNVHINTAGTGSGIGISSAAAGTVQIGASDAYLLPAQMNQYPNLLDIPLAISAQMINYNIPGIPGTTHLNMTGNILAQIYNGTISYWDNSQITAINPGVTLPHQIIHPIHRSDGSGDTFIFTTYLSDTNSWWSSHVGFATSVSFPGLPTAAAYIGNGGMVQGCQQTPYCIAYIGISFMTNTQAAGLGYAYLQNRAGNFVNITQANIQAAAAQMVAATPPNEALSLVYAPGANSYPIINYEYAIVSKTQANANTALVVRTFLDWCIDPAYGNAQSYLNKVGFVALPGPIATLSYDQIAQIGP